MPYRSAAGILMALGGVVAVAGLVLIGIDVYAASRRGPRWKRRLLGAGLVLVGALGGWFARPKPPVMMCYAPMPSTVASAQSLEARLLLLEKMVVAEKLDIEAARTALAAAEADLGRLAGVTGVEAYPGMSGQDVLAIREKARPVIARLRARLGESAALEASDEWKRLGATWAEAEEVASGRRGPYPFSEAGRKDLLARLERLGADAAALAGRGLLSQAEAGLLALEARALAERVGRFRPTELRGATCYKPMDFWPAREGAGRLAARLPLLERLVAQEKVSRPALRKLLAAVDADLATLSDEKELATWVDRAARAEAEQTRDAVRAQVEKLRKLLDGGGQPPINAGGGK